MSENEHKYRIKFRPLEPYTLGTEQGSKFEGIDATGKESYIMTSDTVPNQTTIFGMIRYLVLKGSNKISLKNDFSYNDEERRIIVELIGKSSFTFDASEERKYGKIQEISPVYLIRNRDGNSEEIYVKNPFCNKTENGYIPIRMSDEIYFTSQGETHMPNAEEYDAKKGYGRGYIGLDTKEVILTENIFKKTIQVGNSTDVNLKKDGFFKREVVSMDKDFSFAVDLTTNEKVLEMTKDDEYHIVYIGKKQAAFRVEIKKYDEDIGIKVQESLKVDSNVTWTYALSDVYLKEMVQYKDFAMVETKKLRNMITEMTPDKDYIGRRRKVENQLCLISAGSVFYGDFEIPKDNNCEIAGYNKLVKIGG